MTRCYLLLALFAAACGTTSDAAPAPTSSGKAQRADTGGDGHAPCVEVITRNRTCTDDYIPALVDVRAKYDVPAGIAAEVRTDRAGVIAHAKEEWATDSTDAAIAATCDKLMQTWNGQQADADAARACLTESDCASYTACIMPLFEKRFTKAP
jgi:hypothetical protein